MLASHPSLTTGITLKQPHPQKVLVLGDSLVYGFGDPEGGGWVERLRRLTMAPGREGAVFYNLGVRGDGVSQVKQRLDQEFRYRGEIRNRVPDLLVLLVGVNDSARIGNPLGRNRTDFDEFQGQINNLLSEARQLCPVLFVGMTPVNEQAMPFSEVLYYTHSDQWRYREATRLACTSHNIPYLDVLNLWLGRGEPWWLPLISVDGLHPNVAGYQALLHDILSWDAFQTAVDLPKGYA
ncbi:G-D-S-L family lipolytic protein [Nodosilinea sp. LEGE 07298]|uniref:GDSL-type esterase/lipase family protein n=1 Tax=Nodosilinea sp. LEGE 07298 TaxID=2777970 RepID=UPI00188265B8|nr:GDSL-type esterase/lipase family protein [Nodosilinea sp. LEGE 07298]MBE9113214.1 G-D-S-L family lipolytic protein [Nodosilinea sp. LEGE 07298]